MKKTYLVIAAVFIGSAFVLYLNPFDEEIKLLAGVPLVASVIAGLFKMMSDDTAHSRELIIQSSQNRFSLGASFHMANVAFDKHAEFADQYAQEAHKTLETLFKNGPTREVLGHTAALYTLQQKYAVWLTDKMEAELETFEAALRKIGALSGLVQDTQGTECPDRTEQIRVMYRTFAEVMGLEEWRGEKLTDELAIKMLIRRLRSILGTEELTELRTMIVSNTIADLKKRNK